MHFCGEEQNAIDAAVLAWLSERTLICREIKASKGMAHAISARASSLQLQTSMELCVVRMPKTEVSLETRLLFTMKASSYFCRTASYLLFTVDHEKHKPRPISIVRRTTCWDFWSPSRRWGACSMDR